MTLSRRETLQWVMAAAALPLARWTPAMAAGTDAPPPFEVADWPDAVPPPLPAHGSGRDPDLMAPKVPWPLPLSTAQRATIDLLGGRRSGGEGKSGSVRVDIGGGRQIK